MLHIHLDVKLVTKVIFRAPYFISNDIYPELGKKTILLSPFLVFHFK